MPIQLTCARCSKTFLVGPSAIGKRRHCSRACSEAAQQKRIELACELCGKPFTVVASRAIKPGVFAARYCSRACASPGAAKKHVPWMKGKTKESDPRLASAAQKMSQLYKDHPEHNRGERHHFYGKTHTAEARQKMSAAQTGREITPGMLRGLEGGRIYFKGKTAATHPILSIRRQKAAAEQKGRRDPKHAEWSRRYYAEHPEKHPNYILSQRGYETSLERAMRLGLITAGIPFEAQYRLAGLWIDFALVGHQLAIEVDGEYWHDAAKDAVRDTRIVAAGWRIIHFTEKQVKKHLDDCLEQIRALF